MIVKIIKFIFLFCMIQFSSSFVIAQTTTLGISVDDSDQNFHTIYLVGPITADQPKIIRNEIILGVKRGKSISLRLINSLGGDVEAALEIGRNLRSVDAFVSAQGSCFSSCGLIFISGSVRILAVNGVIGFHRPYFAVSVGGKSPTTKEIGALYERVGEYLREMGASPKVFDIIMNTEPENMVTVNFEALPDFILAKDAVYSEVMIGLSARRRGIGTLEYRQIDNTDYTDDCSAFSEDAAQLFSCKYWQREKTMWGVSVAFDKIEARVAEAEKQCALGQEALNKLKEQATYLAVKSLKTGDPSFYRSRFDTAETLAVERCIIDFVKRQGSVE